MLQSHGSASVAARAPSPKITLFSPDALDAQDISFEAYKQKSSNNRKRSFSPMRKMNSPDISPIAITMVDTNARNRQRSNTADAKQGRRFTDDARRHQKKTFNNSNKQSAPAKRKVMFAIGTPLAKRELEHRLSVPNILRDLDLAKYIGIFNDEEIDFEVFLTLSEKDLHDIGINCQQDIELILGKVAEYNTNNGAIEF